jgi:3-oxoacyl-[acyl-carrier-protein] synthase II
VVAGGAEAMVNPLSIASFCAMRAMSTRNDSPEAACRPFDRTRDGFVMAEGAGLVLLEELGLAVDRGARIYAEVLGYGLTGDAYHVTSPPEDSGGTNRCMRMALADAAIEPDEVDYINAHGTATTFNDPLETQSIKKVFGKHAYRLGVSVLAITDGVLPPTINLTDPDDACDLDYVAGAARRASPETVMSNSFGFGGTNACLVLRRFEERR